MFDQNYIQVLSLAKKSGINLWIENGSLKYKAEKGALTEELKERISQFKTQIIEWLSTQDDDLQNIILPTDNTANTLVSHEQRMFWDSSEISDLGYTYNIPYAFMIEGMLDLPRFKQSIISLISEEKILSTSFYQKGNYIYQSAISNLMEPINIGILEDNEEIIQSHLKLIAQTEFNLRGGPCFCIDIRELNPHKHLVCFVFHHIVADAASLQIIFDKISRHYSGAEDINPVIAKYVDYAYWQNESDVSVENINASISKITTLPNKSLLPADNILSGDFSNKGDNYSFRIEPRSTKLIKLFCKENNLSLNVGLLTVFFILLRKYSRFDLQCIGTPITTRDTKQKQSLIGPMLNTAAITADINLNLSFHDILKKINTEMAEAMTTSSSLPFSELVRQLSKVHNCNVKLFNTMFIMQPFNSEMIHIDGCVCTEVSISLSFSKFDLTLSLRDDNEQLKGNIEYKSNLFTQIGIEHVAQQYVYLLEQLILNPNQPLNQLKISPSIHCAAITDYLYEKSICQSIFEHVMNTPNAVALKNESKEYTYMECWTRALNIANVICQETQKGMVGLLMERSTEAVIAALGIFLANKTYLPIDVTNPPERINFIIEDSLVDLLIVDSKDSDNAFRGVKLLEYDEIPLEKNETPFNNVQADKNDPAYIIYTSGSTGKPKGVIVSYYNLSHYLEWVKSNYIEKYNIRKSLVHSSLAFDLTITSMFGPLISGGTVVVPNGNGAEVLLDYVRSHQDLGLVKLTPSHLKLIINSLSSQFLSHKNGLIIVGGEALFADDIQALLTYSPKIVFINEYGPTETTVGCAEYIIDKNNVNQFSPHDPIPIGNPIDHMDMLVLDESGHVCPPFVPGEIIILGAGVTAGYLNRSELNKERFITISKQRAYKSGDLAIKDFQGQLIYQGRIDEQVKINGYRIEMGEIEATLNNFNEVKQAVIVHHDKCLIAFIVFHTVEENQIQSIRGKLQEYLPYFMLPKHIVAIDNIYLTTNGKIDKNKLLKYFASISNDEYTNNSIDVNSLTHEEAIIYHIWCNIFDKSKVNIDASFFELGGDSLKVLEISSKIKRHGYNIKPADIYKHYSIRLLAKKMKSLAATDTNAVKRTIKIEGIQEPLPVMNWFLGLPHSNIHHYNQSFIYETSQPITGELLKESICAIVNTHPSLRLRVNPKDNSLFYSDLDSTFRIDEFDISKEDHSKLYTKLQKSLNIHNGPTILLAILTNPRERKCELLIICHHLVMDLVSWSILIEDLEQAYLSISNGTLPTLSNEESTIHDWQKELLNYYHTEEFHPQIEYWLNICNKSKKYLFDRVTNPTAHYCKVNHSLQLGSLEDLCKLNDVSMESLLLALVGNGLSKLTNHKEIAISLEHHGRELIFDSIDLSRTIGWFTSQFPFLLPLTSQFNLTYLRICETALHNIPDKGIGFGILKYAEDCAYETIKQCSPNICFNYLGKINTSLNADRLFIQINSETGQSIDPTLMRQFDLEINCYIFNEEINFEFHFNKGTVTESHLNDIVTGINAGYHLSINEMDKYNLNHAGFKTKNQMLDLGPLQGGLLYHAITQSLEHEYVTQLSWDINSEIDIDRLKQAWLEVVAKVEALRTIFTIDSTIPKQIILDDHQPEITVYHLTPQDVNSELDSIEEKLYLERIKRFDLLKHPASRVAIIRVNNDKTIFCWTHHHILIDGWSASNVKTMLENAYLRPGSLELTSYQPYINYLSQLNKNSLIKYWKSTLTNISHQSMPKLNAGNISHKGELGVFLDSELSKAIVDFSKRHLVTPNAIFQAAWSMLLSHYKGTNDIVFGITFSHRPFEVDKIEQAVGLYINTLPLRINLENASIIDVIQLLQRKSLEIVEHGAINLVEIGKHCKIDHPGNLIDELFVFENYPTSSEKNTELNLENLRSVERTKSGLVLIVAPGTSYEVKFSFNREHYSYQSIERMRDQLIYVISQIINIVNHDTKIDEIHILPPTQVNTLLSEWNMTDFSFPDELPCIHDYLRRSTAKFPNKNAVIANDGTLTFEQLFSLSIQFAKALKKYGLEVGDRCAVHLDGSKHILTVFYAILKCGGIIVPIDVNYPPGRIKNILEDSRPTLIITDRVIENVHCKILTIKEIEQIDVSEFDEMQMPIVSSSDQAYIIYTSGSTGKPKGVLINHSSTTNMIENIILYFGISSESRILAFSSISFDAFVAEWAPSIAAGATLYISSRMNLLSPDYLISYINKHAITIITLPPALLALLPADQFPTVKTLVSAGEACPLTQVNKWAHNRLFINGYGPTEAAVCTTLSVLNKDDKTVTIGTPVRNKKVYLLDSHCRPVAIGAPGEIYISGKGISQGYLNQPELTDARFIPDIFHPKYTMYKSGDVARWLENGQIEYLGRTDNQIQLRGFRIELSEIKYYIESHAAVNQSFVAAKMIGDNLTLVAFVLLNEDAKITESILKNYLKSELPEYMVPQHIIFVDRFPLNQNGKIDGEQLHLPLIENNSEHTISDDIEYQIIEIFSKLLNHSVKPDDDFFVLGGHSLLVVKLMNEIENIFQFKIPLNLIFELRTARNIYQFIQVTQQEKEQSMISRYSEDSEELII